MVQDSLLQGKLLRLLQITFYLSSFRSAMPPGGPPFPGMPMPPFPPPPGMMLGPNGLPLPPFPPPPGMMIPGMPPGPPGGLPPPQFVHASAPPQFKPQTLQNAQPIPARTSLIPPATHQFNPDIKKPTQLKYPDANHSPDEKRALHKMYQDGAPKGEDSRGLKRPRAEDFL